MKFGDLFSRTYLKRDNLIVVEIGSQDVNGSLRSVFRNHNYIGVDFAVGNGVDIVLSDPYSIPLGDESVDVVITSSCLEHSEFFWLMFNEMLRILKPNGLLYINAPSNGEYHRWPVDCWRFYPDSGVALEKWGKRSGYNVVLLESFTGVQEEDMWNDFISVFVKDETNTSDYPDRMHSRITTFTNCRTYGNDAIINFVSGSEDQLAHATLKRLKLK